MLGSRKSLIVIKFIGSTSDLPAGTPSSCQEDPQTLPEREHMVPKEEREQGIKDKGQIQKQRHRQRQMKITHKTNISNMSTSTEMCPFPHTAKAMNAWETTGHVFLQVANVCPVFCGVEHTQMCVPYFAAVSTLFLSRSWSEVNNITQLVICSDFQQSHQNRTIWNFTNTFTWKTASICGFKANHVFKPEHSSMKVNFFDQSQAQIVYSKVWGKNKKSLFSSCKCFSSAAQLRQVYQKCWAGKSWLKPTREKLARLKLVQKIGWNWLGINWLKLTPEKLAETELGFKWSSKKLPKDNWSGIKLAWSSGNDFRQCFLTYIYDVCVFWEIL